MEWKSRTAKGVPDTFHAHCKTQHVRKNLPKSCENVALSLNESWGYPCWACAAAALDIAVHWTEASYPRRPIDVTVRDLQSEKFQPKAQHQLGYVAGGGAADKRSRYLPYTIQEAEVVARRRGPNHRLPCSRGGTAQSRQNISTCATEEIAASAGVRARSGHAAMRIARSRMGGGRALWGTASRTHAGYPRQRGRRRGGTADRGVEEEQVDAETWTLRGVPRRMPEARTVRSGHWGVDVDMILLCGPYVTGYSRLSTRKNPQNCNDSFSSLGSSLTNGSGR